MWCLQPILKPGIAQCRASNLHVVGSRSPEVTPTGQAAVVGARVATGPLFGTTDENGFYSISGLYAVSSSFTNEQGAGYETDTRTLDNHRRHAIRHSRHAKGDLHRLWRGIRSDADGADARRGCPDWRGPPPPPLGRMPEYPPPRPTPPPRHGLARASGVSSGKNNYLWATKEGYDDSAPERRAAVRGGSRRRSTAPRGSVRRPTRAELKSLIVLSRARCGAARRRS